MMFCKITDISDIKCSANRMWPDKINEHGFLKFFLAPKIPEDAA